MPMLLAGRPVGEERLPAETAVYDLLDQLHIPYWRVDHPAAYTMEDCRETDRLLEAAICKNLLLCSAHQTAFYLLMLRGDKHLQTKMLARQIGCSRLSFAPPAALVRLLGLQPGAVSVLGLMNDREHAVRLLIDRDVAEAPFLGCHPCVNTTSLRLRTEDILSRFLPHTGHDYTLVSV